MANTNIAGVNQKNDGGTGGIMFGKSVTDKISFHGATPIVKPTVEGTWASVTGYNLCVALADLGLIINNSVSP